ncbi:ABC transporter permease [Caminibacter pacificus]|uniref:ABC transporter permease n=1 Tax=Caminibacter pacificus TaxID=1424653 RepID=A0AAJ4RC21_9BACT|nr:ABC transporter permease [Caminibacter pacificus]QCI29010.1 ABC transporter permease [Caminibacter pacificus]ROR39181.1 ABC-type multidrug transport system permease subunit [Caminibacter pacificus]
MRLHVIKAYLKKEFIDLVRSKMIILVYFVPSLIIFLFGYGLKLEITHAKTMIIDRDNTPLSLKIVNSFEHSKYFDTQVKAISDNEALKLFKKAKLDVLIIIPPSFQKKLLHQKKARVGVYIDGSFPLRALTLEGYVKGMFLHILGDKAPVKKIILVNQRNMFNESLRDANAFIPGVIGLVLLIAPAVLAALVIVKEKEQGTIFNFYSSPVSKTEFLIAKLTPPFLLHSVNIFILFLWATYYFDVPFRGSFLLFWIAAEIFVFVSVGIGLLVSVFTSTQIAALILTVILTVVPGFLYSGILMPISSMDKISQIESHAFPIMYFNHISYDSFLVGAGFSSALNLEYLAVLFVYGAVLFLLGLLFLKKAIK